MILPLQMEGEENFNPDYILDMHNLSADNIYHNESKEEGELDITLIAETQRLERILLPEKVVKDRIVTMVEHDKIEQPNENVPYTNNGPFVICKIDGDKFSRMFNFQRHWEIKHEKMITVHECPDCKRQIYRWNDFLAHGRRVHHWDGKKVEDVERNIEPIRRENLKYVSPRGKVLNKDEKIPYALKPTESLFETVPIAPITSTPIPQRILSPGPMLMPLSSSTHINQLQPSKPLGTPASAEEPTAKKRKTTATPTEPNKSIEMPLPPPPPKCLADAKGLLEKKRRERDLIVREVDELYILTQRFRLKERTPDFTKEHNLRLQAESRVKDLETQVSTLQSENTGLREAIRTLVTTVKP